MNAKGETHSSPVLVLLAWAVVLVPLGWGVTYTVENAAKLFTAPSPPAVVAPASSPHG